MHTLSRQIRFSIHPFVPQTDGYNSYVSKPISDQLSFYFSLWVDLVSDLHPDTGFVVNVSDIDKVVRSKTLAQFDKVIKNVFSQGRSLSLTELVELLRQCWPLIQQGFEKPKLSRLRLELNPFRTIILNSEDTEMFLYSEKFEFAAMHQLWNDKFDLEKNYQMFGKCANPAGHGHNYIIEVQIQSPSKSLPEGWLYDYQNVIKENFLDIVDHKNLNVDVQGFQEINPTVENLSAFAWQKLEEKFKNAKLHKVIIWENDRTYCSYSK